MPQSGQTLFSIAFRDPESDKVLTVKARQVCDSQLGLGFICMSEFVFETGGRLVDPNADALRKRFEGVKRLHVNLYRVLSISEMGEENQGLQLDGERAKLVVLHGPGGDRAVDE